LPVETEGFVLLLQVLWTLSERIILKRAFER